MDRENNPKNQSKHGINKVSSKAVSTFKKSDSFESQPFGRSSGKGITFGNHDSGIVLQSQWSTSSSNSNLSPFSSHSGAGTQSSIEEGCDSLRSTTSYESSQDSPDVFNLSLGGASLPSLNLSPDQNRSNVVDPRSIRDLSQSGYQIDGNKRVVCNVADNEVVTLNQTINETISLGLNTISAASQSSAYNSSDLSSSFEATPVQSLCNTLGGTVGISQNENCKGTSLHSKTTFINSDSEADQYGQYNTITSNISEHSRFDIGLSASGGNKSIHYSEHQDLNSVAGISILSCSDLRLNTSEYVNRSTVNTLQHTDASGTALQRLNEDDSNQDTANTSGFDSSQSLKQKASVKMQHKSLHDMSNSNVSDCSNALKMNNSNSSTSLQQYFTTSSTVQSMNVSDDSVLHHSMRNNASTSIPELLTSNRENREQARQRLESIPVIPALPVSDKIEDPKTLQSISQNISSTNCNYSSNFSVDISANSAQPPVCEDWRAVEVLDYPAELMREHYDGVIIHADDDEEDVRKLIEILEKFVTTTVNKTKVSVKLCPWIDARERVETSSRTNAVEEVLEVSTLIFVFVTEELSKDDWAKFFTDVCIVESIENALKKHSVIPILTQPKNKDIKIPLVLKSIRGYDLPRLLQHKDIKTLDVSLVREHNLNSAVLENLKKSLELHYGTRITREQNQERKRQMWKERRQQEISRENLKKESELQEQRKRFELDRRISEMEQTARAEAEIKAAQRFHRVFSEEKRQEYEEEEFQKLIQQHQELQSARSVAESQNLSRNSTQKSADGKSSDKAVGSDPSQSNSSSSLTQTGSVPSSATSSGSVPSFVLSSLGSVPNQDSFASGNMPTIIHNHHYHDKVINATNMTLNELNLAGPVGHVQVGNNNTTSQNTSNYPDGLVQCDVTDEDAPEVDNVVIVTEETFTELATADSNHNRNNYDSSSSNMISTYSSIRNSTLSSNNTSNINTSISRESGSTISNNSASESNSDMNNSLLFNRQHTQTINSPQSLASNSITSIGSSAVSGDIDKSSNSGNRTDKTVCSPKPITSCGVPRQEIPQNGNSNVARCLPVAKCSAVVQRPVAMIIPAIRNQNDEDDDTMIKRLDNGRQRRNDSDNNLDDDTMIKRTDNRQWRSNNDDDYDETVVKRLGLRTRISDTNPCGSDDTTLIKRLQSSNIANNRSQSNVDDDTLVKRLELSETVEDVDDDTLVKHIDTDGASDRIADNTGEGFEIIANSLNARTSGQQLLQTLPMLQDTPQLNEQQQQQCRASQQPVVHEQQEVMQQAQQQQQRQQQRIDNQQQPQQNHQQQEQLQQRQPQQQQQQRIVNQQLLQQNHQQQEQQRQRQPQQQRQQQAQPRRAIIPEADNKCCIS